MEHVKHGIDIYSKTLLSHHSLLAHFSVRGKFDGLTGKQK